MTAGATAGMSLESIPLSVPLPVRADLTAAHDRAWRRLAAPGRWWTGAERLAVAAETRRARDCPRCAERNGALSPEVAAGRHGPTEQLPAALVDAVHRIATDPARLSRRWLDRLLAEGIDESRYVEALGVVAALVNLDTFDRTIGRPPRPLPEPGAGEPSRRRPAGARPGAAWVSWIEPAGATGEEADLYPGGQAPNVLRALSLAPEEVRGLVDLVAAQYVPAADILRVDLPSGRGLSRVQMEFLAARVSALNQCFY